MPTRVLNYATPLQTLKNTFPNTRLTSDLPLKIFRCTVFVHVPTRFLSKFDPRIEKCIFLGYAPNKKKGISVLILLLGKFMLVWMSTLLKIFPFITKLLFGGRTLMKISFGNKNNQNLVFFFLK